MKRVRAACTKTARQLHLRGGSREDTRERITGVAERWSEHVLKQGGKHIYHERAVANEMTTSAGVGPCTRITLDGYTPVWHHDMIHTFLWPW